MRLARRSGAAHIDSAGDGVQYVLSKGTVNSFTIGLSQETRDKHGLD